MTVMMYLLTELVLDTPKTKQQEKRKNKVITVNNRFAF